MSGKGGSPAASILTRASGRIRSPKRPRLVDHDDNESAIGLRTFTLPSDTGTGAHNDVRRMPALLCQHVVLHLVA